MYLVKKQSKAIKNKWIPHPNQSLVDVLGLCVNAKYFKMPENEADVATQMIIVDHLLGEGNFIQVGDYLIYAKV